MSWYSTLCKETNHGSEMNAWEHTATSSISKWAMIILFWTQCQKFYLESRTQNSAGIVREREIGNREQLKETWAWKMGGGERGKMIGEVIESSLFYLYCSFWVYKFMYWCRAYNERLQDCRGKRINNILILILTKPKRRKEHMRDHPHT